jgi:hypothetical protein
MSFMGQVTGRCRRAEKCGFGTGMLRNKQPAAQSGHRKMLLGAIESGLSHDSLRRLQILRP